jgi:adenylylsulfate kinase
MAQHDENVVWHPHPVTVAQREQLHGHRGVVLWFTGLSGSGKSTVAGALEKMHESQIPPPAGEGIRQISYRRTYP